MTEFKFGFGEQRYTDPVGNGDPCSGRCCADPDLTTPEHECEDDFCEGCYGIECLACGGVCYCEL